MADTVNSLLAQRGVAPSEFEIIVADDDPGRGASEGIRYIAQSTDVRFSMLKVRHKTYPRVGIAVLRALRQIGLHLLMTIKLLSPTGFER